MTLIDFLANEHLVYRTVGAVFIYLALLVGIYLKGFADGRTTERSENSCTAKMLRREGESK